VGRHGDQGFKFAKQSASNLMVVARSQRTNFPTNNSSCQATRGAYAHKWAAALDEVWILLLEATALHSTSISAVYPSNIESGLQTSFWYDPWCGPPLMETDHPPPWPTKQRIILRGVAEQLHTLLPMPRSQRQEEAKDRKPIIHRQ
jgi:hypothetical protein